MAKQNKIKTDSYAKQFVDQPTPFFKKGWKSIELPDYPEDSIEELDEVLAKMRNRTEKEEKEIEKHDKRYPAYELEFLKIINDESDKAKKFIYDLTGQLFTICMYFKNKFNRKRPWQFAKENEIEFPKIKTETGVTAAYPSGHTFTGHFVAEVLARKYPDKRKQLFEFAAKVSDGRIKKGVHYPSDVEGGKLLAKKLMKYYAPSSEGMSFKEFFSNFL